jgi:hypothetical protein
MIYYEEGDTIRFEYEGKKLVGKVIKYRAFTHLDTTIVSITIKAEDKVYSIMFAIRDSKVRAMYSTQDVMDHAMMKELGIDKLDCLDNL